MLQDAACTQNNSAAVSIGSQISPFLSILNLKPAYFPIFNGKFDNLGKFWELEESSAYTPKFKGKSIEEVECEKHFLNTYKRLPCGRYELKLPFNDKLPFLGESRSPALRRLLSLGKRLTPELFVRYSDVINEYLSLGHLELVPESELNNSRVFYLPHHAVINESKLTSKLRVVFDGSATTTSGVSLNDVLMSGLTIQEDLISILLRFRKHKYVLIADIEKMYRQVSIDPNDRDMLRILWRDRQTGEILTYRLTRVTFGLKPSAFQAIRSIHQLAFDENPEFPLTSEITITDFYVDDLLTGNDDFQIIIVLCDQLSKMFKKGGFKLVKMSSNDPKILKYIKESNKDVGDDSSILIAPNDIVKTLGLVYNTFKDWFLISNLSIFEHTKNSKITKRSILSDTSKIFDPLSFLSPLVIRAKLIMQDIWKLKILWDESVPQSIFTLWTNFCSDMLLISKLEIPRHVVSPYAVNVELHGFSDASIRAYGACIYVRSIDKDETSHCQLLISKSRVAPLHSTSLPRLELCGALLLSRLLSQVLNAMRMPFSAIFLWTDSTITLDWIREPPNRWKTFVANRVAEIQLNTKNAHWCHVSSDQNPADLISRGVQSSTLINSSLWWHGPEMLHNPGIFQHCHQDIRFDNDLSTEMQSSCTSHVISIKPFDLFEKYSSLSKLIRVFAYVQRFIFNSKSKNKPCRKIGELTAAECDSSLNKLMKIAQSEAISRDISDLSSGALHKKA
nr:PREDICTED: uncharacterized protein LOC109041538 [Bemisia tabaci]